MEVASSPTLLVSTVCVSTVWKDDDIVDGDDENDDEDDGDA